MKMDQAYRRLLDGNRAWAEHKKQEDAQFFVRLSQGQSPDVLWIGCADSRVSADAITNTDPGEIFVHRNIANMVVHTDLNMLSVLQYAVEVLHVKHVIVCGHYGCGGVKAAMTQTDNGIVNKWLRNIKEVYAKYYYQLDAIEDETERLNRLVEFNVMEQVRNLAKTSIVQKAWRKRALQIHGWVFGMHDGIIHDLDVMIHEIEDLEPIFRYTLPELENIDDEQ